MTNTKKPTLKSPHTDDLAWLFNNCESEMGISSNFSAVTLASTLGSKKARKANGDKEGASDPVLPNPEDAIIGVLDSRPRSRSSATAKNRKVMRSYHLMHVHHQRIIEAAYTPRR